MRILIDGATEDEDEECKQYFIINVQEGEPIDAVIQMIPFGVEDSDLFDKTKYLEAFSDDIGDIKIRYRPIL